MSRSIVFKVALAALIILISGIFLLGVVIMQRIDQQVSDTSLQSQKLNLRVAALLLQDAYPDLKVTIGADGETTKLVMPEIPDLSSHSLIDRIGTATGQTATVFSWVPAEKDFIRVSTNIIKPDGQRAVGTMLGNGSAAYGPTTSGKTFRGEAVILGTAYITQYTPIFNPGGDVIGILYVGIAKAEVAEVATAIELRIAIAGIVVALIAGVLLVVLLRWQLGPLHVLGNTIARFVDRDFSGEVAYTGRTDEIGVIADGLVRWKETAGQIKEAEEARITAEKRNEDERVQQRNRLAKQLEESVGQIVSSVRQATEGMMRSTRQMRDSADHSVRQSSHVSEAANESARSV
ncbi:MAG TPA: methyl-accepting chemotaxis protein, partial [Thalassospira sp.]|nr:methyl-accepting chemotaxis protein [Thalassospira sp.]